MAKDTSFVLDTSGAEGILTKMMMPTIQERANAIASRARSMASSMSTDPPEITVSTRVGTIKQGVRAIADIKAEGNDAHQNYIGHIVLAKAKDAGRG